MAEFTRKFTHQPAIRADVPLLIGITGASSSGKTFSAMELATGVQSVRGGSIFVNDTEGGRARHYSDKFKIQHVPFAPPFSPLDYQAAIDHCAAAGAKIVVVDSMSHEHDGDGGVLEQIEDYLDRQAGTDWAKRDRLKFAAQIKPKAQRKQLNQRILQLTDITWIFCYRAHEKIRINEKDAEGRKLDPQKGWAPISTSPLFFDMTLRLLLPPGSDGRPLFSPTDEAEKLLTKLPYQFRDWFKPGDQLTAEIGRKLALWAKGEAAQSPAPTTAPPVTPTPVAVQHAPKGTVTATVRNVADEPKAAGRAQWYVIHASDGNPYYTKDASVADRARNACEVEAEMEFGYAMKPGAGGGSVRVIESFTVKKED